MRDALGLSGLCSEVASFKYADVLLSRSGQATNKPTVRHVTRIMVRFRDTDLLVSIETLNGRISGHRCGRQAGRRSLSG